MSCAQLSVPRAAFSKETLSWQSCTVDVEKHPNGFQGRASVRPGTARCRLSTLVWQATPWTQKSVSYHLASCVAWKEQGETASSEPLCCLCSWGWGFTTGWLSHGQHVAVLSSHALVWPTQGTLGAIQNETKPCECPCHARRWALLWLKQCLQENC